MRTKLPERTEKLVLGVTEELRTELGDKSLILMTASGVDIRQLSEECAYPGLHVGSYPDMLLKRCLMALPYPKVIFLHPGKWGFEFTYSNCHAVCDESFQWDNLISSSPIAVALAADTQTRQQELAIDLMSKGFSQVDIEEPPAGTKGPWSIIAANTSFSDFFRVL